MALILAISPGLAQTEPTSADAPTATTPVLVEIPYPDMEGLEDAVKDQLNEAHGDLTAWLRRDDPPAAELTAAFGRLGQLLHAYNLAAAAEASYLNASTLAPNDFRWHYYLGRLYQQSGRFEQAAARYRRALELAAGDVAARVHLGEVLRTQNRLDDATAELRRALENDPQNPAARAILGEIALARGDHRAAVELLSAALEQVPDANRLHYPLAMAYRGLGDLEAARRHLDQSGAVGLKVADPLMDELERLATGERVHLLRGRQAFAAGRYGAAASEFRQAMAADPRSARVRVNLGSALGQMGDVVGAIEQYAAALALDPANVTARFNLGLLTAQQGDFEQAAQHFAAAIELKYDDSEAHRRLGRALRRLGRHDEALEHLREAVTLEPRSESARHDEAALLVDLGRFRDARERLEEAHALMPTAGGIAHALARVLAASPEADLRDGERALDLAERVYDAQPTPAHALTVAMALAELDRCAEAAEWLAKLVNAAEEQGAQEWAAAQREVLARYQAGPPCR